MLCNDTTGLACVSYKQSKSLSLNDCGQGATLMSVGVERDENRAKLPHEPPLILIARVSFWLRNRLLSPFFIANKKKGEKRPKEKGIVGYVYVCVCICICLERDFMKEKSSRKPFGSNSGFEIIYRSTHHKVAI